MPAQSQQQQKLFGLALSVKRGDTPRSEASEEVLKIVDSMTEKEIEDFAGTEHEGLPKKVEQKIREMARQTIKERMMSEVKFGKGDMVRVVDNPKYVMDKKKFAGMSGYVKNTIGRDIQVTFPNGRTILVDPKDLEMNPNESVNEAAGKEAMGIAALTGTRGDAVQKFIDTHEINPRKLFNFLKKGKLNDIMDFVTALSGKPNNPIQQKMVKMFRESVNKDATQLWSQTIDMLDKNLKKGYDPSKIRNVNLIAGTLQKLFKGLPQRNAMDMATSYNDYKAGQKDKNQTVKDWVRILKKHQIKESSLSTIHRAAKKGSYPVTVMAIDKKKRKVVKQELVKTPMAVPAAFTMMQGRYPEASISVEDATGQVLFSESVNEGKNSASWTSPKTGKSYDIQKNGNRWEMDIMKKGSSIYDKVTTIKRKTPQELKDWLDGYKIDSKWMEHLLKSVNEANGNFVVYVEKDNGRKKLLRIKKSQRAANMFMSKNMDKILNSSGIRSIGSMSQDQWEKKEAQFAENIKKSDMKTVTKKEWDRTHKDYKGMIKGQPYMMWFDKKTQSTVYGPVQIKG